LTSPEEPFVSDEDYPIFCTKLDGLRGKVIDHIPVERRMRVLDIATGAAQFAAEFAERDPTMKVFGVDIAEPAIRSADRLIRGKWLDARVTAMRMDATRLEFPAAYFGMAINFLGLEDIHATKGAQGVRETFHEVSRVLRSRGYFSFTVMPPEEAETTAQELECAFRSYSVGATWLPAIKYQEFLRGAGFTLLKREVLGTGKRLSAAQIMPEMERECKTAKKTWGIEAKPFEDVWAKYGGSVEKNGIGRCSRLVLMIARKKD
jgi:ubiquinone/menaquinone biosynthesis C-methylase UbiE